MQAIKTELLQLLNRNDLMRSLFLVSRVTDPTFSEAGYIEKVLEMAAKIWNLSSHCKNDPILKAESINRVLFKESGILGKTDRYKQVIDDPQRYYLHPTLDKKASSPLSVTLIYSVLAMHVGLEHEIFAMPNYYILKVNDKVGPFYIDPFENGRFLTEEEFHRKFKTILQRNRMASTNLFEKIAPAQLVSRLLHQLKHIFILKGNAIEALRTVELLTAIFPESPELTRDRGILYCEMEYFSKAMEDLKFYLKARPKAEDVSEIKKLTSMLKGYREILN